MVPQKRYRLNALPTWNGRKSKDAMMRRLSGGFSIWRNVEDTSNPSNGDGWYDG